MWKQIRNFMFLVRKVVGASNFQGKTVMVLLTRGPSIISESCNVSMKLCKSGAQSVV